MWISDPKGRVKSKQPHNSLGGSGFSPSKNEDVGFIEVSHRIIYFLKKKATSPIEQ